jgi:hypothetical protein
LKEVKKMDIGIDVGFHTTKAAWDGRDAIFASFVSKFRSSRVDVKNEDAISIQSESGHFLVGDQALRLGQGARQESAQWLGSPEWLTLFYAAISELTTAAGFGARVVIGLPLSDYDRDKKAIAEIVRGHHTFKRNGNRAQSFDVTDLRVVPQAWGAVLDELLDKNGKVVNEEISDQRVAVIDIGGHTVNYLAVDGLADIPDESRGTERGAWSVVRAVREFLDREHPDLARYKDHTLMQATVKSVIPDGDEEVRLGPVIGPIIEDIGQEIVRTARQYWGQGAGTFRQVLVIGGGAHLWFNHIKTAFKHARMLDNPVMVNARGFAKFAAYLGADND